MTMIHCMISYKYKKYYNYSRCHILWIPKYLRYHYTHENSGKLLGFTYTNAHTQKKKNQTLATRQQMTHIKLLQGGNRWHRFWFNWLPSDSHAGRERQYKLEFQRLACTCIDACVRACVRLGMLACAYLCWASWWCSPGLSGPSPVRCPPGSLVQQAHNHTTTPVRVGYTVWKELDGPESGSACVIIGER